MNDLTLEQIALTLRSTIARIPEYLAEYEQLAIQSAAALLEEQSDRIENLESENQVLIATPMNGPRSVVPKQHPCKFCGVPAGQNCVQKDGSKRDWSHLGRGPEAAGTKR